MTFTSYAQNFEDVMLWRALSHITHGFYVDIGAQDPVVDSVSLAFHEHGWHGVHVEPVPYYAELLRQQRPGDTVIQAAVGNDPCVLRFFEIPETGISTADASIAAEHRRSKFNVRETVVPCITLSAIFDAIKNSDIHWLKIDVEGFEAQVLLSWGSSPVRPWIVVVESTFPRTQIETYDSWEKTLTAYGYTAVYFDGLNRYYVSELRPELKAAFLAPPNIFDGFALSGTATATFHKVIEMHYQEKVRESISQSNEHEQEIEREHAKQIQQFQENLDDSLRTSARWEEELSTERLRIACREEELSKELLTIRRQAENEESERTRQYREKVVVLQRQNSEHQQKLELQLRFAKEDLSRLEQSAAAKERRVQEDCHRMRAELEASKQTLAERDRELAAQILESGQAARNLTLLTLDYSEARRVLTEEITSLSICGTGLDESAGVIRETLNRQLIDLYKVIDQLAESQSIHEIQTQEARARANRSVENAGKELDQILSELIRGMQCPLDKSDSEPVSTSPDAGVSDASSVSSVEELLSLRGAAFVYCAYKKLLGRPPDPTGAKFYLERIRAGIPKIQIISEIAQSAEGTKYERTISGMESALRTYRMRRWPLLGSAIRFFASVTVESRNRTKIRALSEEIHQKSEEDQEKLMNIRRILIDLYERLEIPGVESRFFLADLPAGLLGLRASFGSLGSLEHEISAQLSDKSGRYRRVELSLSDLLRSLEVSQMAGLPALDRVQNLNALSSGAREVHNQLLHNIRTSARKQI